MQTRKRLGLGLAALTALGVWCCTAPAWLNPNAHAAEAIGPIRPILPISNPDGWFDLGTAPMLSSDTTPVAIPPGAPGKAYHVDTANRADVVAFFNSAYRRSQSVDAGWTGNMDTCTAGETSAAYATATINRVNYYRAMAGLAAGVTLDADLNAQCQEAALIMIANAQLSHFPPISWTCYTEAGAEAAGHSNIALGSSGPDAIDGYVEDSGTNNTAAGHRRWILYPSQQVMGTGSVTASNGFYFGANALWVIDGAKAGASQAVAWPPEGYVPYQVVYPRWSFAYPEADWSQTTVTMTRGGLALALNVLLPLAYGYGDNTIVWEPQGIPAGAPEHDDTYAVTVANVKIGGSLQDFTYNVTIIDAGAAEGEGEPSDGAEGEGDTNGGPTLGGCLGLP